MKRIIDKKEVEASFSNASQTYDNFARMQKKATELLLDTIERNHTSMPDGAVLELGCGTGQMSSCVNQMLHFRKLVFSDISTSMVETCKKKISDGSQSSNDIHYLVLDAEELSDDSKYAAVFSGLTVQWFSDFQATVKRIYNALVPGGEFIFSCLVRGSFPEWFSVCEQIHVPCTANTLRESQNINHIVSAVFDSAESISRTIEIEYPSAAYFFRSLKFTGTNVQIGHQTLTVNQMRRLIKYWDDSLNGDKLTIKYVIDIIVAKKK